MYKDKFGNPVEPEIFSRMLRCEKYKKICQYQRNDWVIETTWLGTAKEAKGKDCFFKTIIYNSGYPEFAIYSETIQEALKTHHWHSKNYIDEYCKE